MTALILVDSESGNTLRIAEAIADGLAPVPAVVLRIGVDDLGTVAPGEQHAGSVP